MQALKSGKELEQEANHRSELPVALSTSTYANSQKTKPPYFNPLDFCFFQPAEANRISGEVADCFLTLNREELLPSWVLDVADIERIRKSAKGQPVQGTRGWMCKGIVLLLPQMKDGCVTSEYALVAEDHPAGKVEIWDLDSDKSYTVIVPAGSAGVREKVKWLIL